MERLCKNTYLCLCEGQNAAEAEHRSNNQIWLRKPSAHEQQYSPFLFCWCGWKTAVAMMDQIWAAKANRVRQGRGRLGPTRTRSLGSKGLQVLTTTCRNDNTYRVGSVGRAATEEGLRITVSSQTRRRNGVADLELHDIFVAGSDTRSTTIEWAMAELLHNPKAMAKARSELAETIGKGKQVEESDIVNLPYLQAVVKETFRLHAPVPLLIPHMALSTAEVCGFTIPQNTQVIVNTWAIGRDGDIWADPTSFLPERLLDSKIDFKGQDFELIPFGAGRRICPGLPLAFRMVHLMLASVLRFFGWKLPDGVVPEEMNMRDKFGITLQMEVPLRAVPVQD